MFQQYMKEKQFQYTVTQKKFNVELGDNVEVWEGYHEENEILTEETLKQYMEAT